MYQLQYDATLRGEELVEVGMRLPADVIRSWKEGQPCRCALPVRFVGVLMLGSEDSGQADRFDIIACLALLGSGTTERIVDITGFVPNKILRRYADLIAEDESGLLGSDLSEEERSDDIPVCLPE